MDKWLMNKRTFETTEDEPSTSNLNIKRKKVTRKYDSEYLKIVFSWNEDIDDPRSQCIICYEMLANESMRPNKLRRHIETKHFDLKDQPLSYFETKLKELKTSKTKIKQFTKVNEKAMHASYLISLRIAKAGKPHTIGENLVLPAIKDAVGVMFGDKSSKDVEMIPLSNDTVERRINEMSQWTEDELIQRVRKSSFFSLQLDESTDVQGLCQLLCCIPEFQQSPDSGFRFPESKLPECTIFDRRENVKFV
eukprot:XP_008183307.1 PREDICTED: zinc finger BED domain-containing protein 5-like [Acyrthosiphon pisum]